MEQETYRTSYEQALEDLIPRAELAANNMVGREPSTKEDMARWSTIYHDTMDRLAAMRGIRRQSWQTYC